MSGRTARTAAHAWLAAIALVATACAGRGDVPAPRRYAAPAARQGVAAADGAFYAIDDRAIEKYDAASGARLARYDAGGDASIVHLNGGIVREGVLYCAHSNYPAVPMQSSIERFDARSLAHLGSQPLTGAPGSATWVERRGGHWWVALAHYAGRGGEPGQGPEHTRLWKLDDRWRPLASYAYPPELVARFAGRSNSGGAFGPDGWLYLTGHDAPELYVACLDEAASALRWLGTWPAPIEGQGIAWDLATATFWGVVRDAREVVAVPARARAGARDRAPRMCPQGKRVELPPPFGR